MVQDNMTTPGSVILQISQNNPEQLLRRLTAELLQITRESRMIREIMILVYLAELASIAHLHWAK